MTYQTNRDKIDLGELPKYEVIIKAPEEKNLPRGKGKAQIGNKAKGPPLVNYIKASEYLKACKMCCNTDYHATFQCPNLTPVRKNSDVRCVYYLGPELEMLLHP